MLMINISEEIQVNVCQILGEEGFSKHKNGRRAKRKQKSLDLVTYKFLYVKKFQGKVIM